MTPSPPVFVSATRQSRRLFCQSSHYATLSEPFLTSSPKSLVNEGGDVTARVKLTLHILHNHTLLHHAKYGKITMLGFLASALSLQSEKRDGNEPRE